MHNRMVLSWVSDVNILCSLTFLRFNSLICLKPWPENRSMRSYVLKPWRRNDCPALRCVSRALRLCTYHLYSPCYFTTGKNSGVTNTWVRNFAAMMVCFKRWLSKTSWSSFDETDVGSDWTCSNWNPKRLITTVGGEQGLRVHLSWVVTTIYLLKYKTRTTHR